MDALYQLGQWTSGGIIYIFYSYVHEHVNISLKTSTSGYKDGTVIIHQILNVHIQILYRKCHLSFHTVPKAAKNHKNPRIMYQVIFALNKS